MTNATGISSTRQNRGPIRLAVVGLGKIARDQHLPALRSSDAFDVVATADPSSRLDDRPSYVSLKDLIASHPDLQAVSICTPPGPRLEIVQQALAAGLHVMVEKPPSAHPKEALAMREWAASYRRTLFFSWHSRETECVTRARAWLRDKEITQIEIDWREDIRQWHPGQTWILESNGFGVFDPAINALSIVTALIPGRCEVLESRLSVPANYASPVAGEVALRTSGGVPVRATLDFLEAGEPRWDIRIETLEGTLFLREGGHALILPNGETARCRDEEYERLYHRFSKLIDEGESDTDARPLEIVADALRVGEIEKVEAFEF